MAAAITAAATSLAVAAGEGARFPSTYPFHISIDNEILRVTNRATDTMTVTRAQEETAAAIHNQGATVQLNITAKTIADLNAAINALETKDKCSLTHSAAQTIATGTWTILAWNTETFDSNDLHNTITNNSRITIKTTGYYVFFLNISFAVNTAGARLTRLYIDGSPVGAYSSNVAPVSGVQTIPFFGTVLYLTAGQYVEIAVWQNSGGNLDTDPARSSTSIAQLT